MKNRKKKTDETPSSENKTNNILGVLARLIMSVAAIALFVTLAVFTLVRGNDTEVTIYKISSAGLKTPVRIALLSDLHQATYGENNCDLIDEISALGPDMICITGDMITKNKADLDSLSNLLISLRQIAPVWYSMGNHEMHEILVNGTDISSIITQAGCVPLANKSEVIEVNGNKLVIGGLSQSCEGIEEYSNGFPEKFMETEPELYHILLSHYPENFDGYIEETVSGLAMSGHAEGGVVRLPFIGALYTPDQGILPKLTAGVHKQGNVTLVISRGLGNHSIVPRIYNKPEIVIIDLK